MYEDSADGQRDQILTIDIMSPRKIVIALDESKQSRLAVDWAGLHVIRKSHDVVTLLYVLPAAVPVVPGDEGEGSM